MSCAELYKRDAGFRGFLQTWLETRRCPLELADYLMDAGFADASGPVAAVRWAASEPERPTYEDTVYLKLAKANMPPEHWARVESVPPKSPPYPGERPGNYLWIRDGFPHSAHEVPPDHTPTDYWGTHSCDKTPENIVRGMVWLLDNWVP